MTHLGTHLSESIGYRAISSVEEKGTVIHQNNSPFSSTGANYFAHMGLISSLGSLKKCEQKAGDTRFKIYKKDFG